MYTDKDRFNFKNSDDPNVRILYQHLARQNILDAHESTFDQQLFPLENGSISDEPELNYLQKLTKVYFLKRLETITSDSLNLYRGEIIDQDDNRIFLVTNDLRYDSDEVIEYGAFRRGEQQDPKVCYGIVNYSGIQMFEIYGEPGKVIKVGPSSSVWGEIQVVPGNAWDEFGFNCCSCCKGKSKANAEIRVVVMKRENESRSKREEQELWKNEYYLRGEIRGGCGHQKNNLYYRKNFNLRLLTKDESLMEEEKLAETKEPPPKEPKAKFNIPIGKFCSHEKHDKRSMHLPVLEFPQSMDIYDKLTLMGAFFIFKQKV